MRAIAIAVVATFASTPAVALSLGSPDVSSFLGQPLMMRVPVVLDDTAEAGGQCLRLINQPGGEVPSLALARIEVERAVTGTFLRVTTTQPIDEPVLRVALEIGCTQRVRREFTLLLDPPAGIATGAGTTPGAAANLPPLIEFGAPQVAGVRGQPLLLTIPIAGDLARSLSSACVATGRSDSADVPRVLNDARVTLLDRDDGRFLRVHTPEAVNDARVRVIVEVGCDRPLRREFVVEVDAPRLAATRAEDAAPVAAPVVPPKRPAKPVEKPPVRVAQPPPPPPAPAPAPVAPPPAKLEPPSPQQAEMRPIEPARLPAPPPPPSDRLILAAPEDRAQDRAAEREAEVLKRVEELHAEILKLRTELDVTARRNRELADQADSARYAWAAASVAALLLGLGIILGWRTRPRAEESPADAEPAGPMTRILGKSAPTRPVPPPAMTDGAGPATLAAIAAAHRSHEQDTQGVSTAIMVTEFRDTTQVLGELYSPYIERGPPTQPNPQQANPQPKADVGMDLDLGQERTTVFSPQTKTEIAVDIDVFESNSQIGRDLQREYERLDLAGGPSPAPPAPPPPEPDPASLLDATTMPLTTKLDLDLDLSTVAQPPKPKKE